MTEKFSTSVETEANERIRVLEIGSGPRPAIERGGKLFKNPLVDYVAIDIDSEDYDPRGKNTSRNSFVLANAAHLPFGNDTFDYILIRDVFGKFTDPDFTSHIVDIRDWGVFEAFRTLRPGGQIVVAEENSPWQEEQVENILLSAGFEKVHIARSLKTYNETRSDNHYRRTRRKFYNDRPIHSGFLLFDGYPYLMTAQKPTNPEYLTIEAEIFKLTHKTKPVITINSGVNFARRSNDSYIATKVYQKGKSNLRPPRRRR